MAVTTVDAPAARKSIEHIQAITTLVATTVGMFCALRWGGGGGALRCSTTGCITHIYVIAILDSLALGLMVKKPIQ